MKKKYRKFLAGVLVASLCLGIAGCGQSASDVTSVYLDYGTGIDEDGDYNEELYGMNNNDTGGADPGVFWVSEEEDSEYGGYFYKYITIWTVDSDTAINTEFCEEEGIAALAYKCYRSKDLYQWERCGVLPGGYSLQVDNEDWPRDNLWAPEVIKSPIDGKYYMYFSANAPENWGAVTGVSNSDYEYDRLYLAVAVCDTPVGPFDILYNTDVETGKRIPTINFHEGCNTEFDWAAIDVSPFFDDNGDFYLYFNKHKDSNYASLNGIWGMKMKSMTQPDYSTIVCLTQPNNITASSTPGDIESTTQEGNYFYSEGGVNEGPTMIKHNGIYYLTYSANGYKSHNYSVHMAVSDSPLGTFRKLDGTEGNPVLDGSAEGYMVGTAHHSIVEKGDELYIVYHRLSSIYTYSGRAICADRLNWTTNKDGLDILVANGPSKSLQWLSESVSGYKNLAQTADIKISTGTGVNYLTDGIIPFTSAIEDYVMQSESGDVKITFQWDEPVSVSSIMIYNGMDESYAFSNISDIRFKLAEQPDWASKAYDYAVIQDLVFPSRYWDADSEEYIAGAPAVAEFDSIMVTEISITIKEGDRLVEYDKFGETNVALKIAEIVILGGNE